MSHVGIKYAYANQDKAHKHKRRHKTNAHGKAIKTATQIMGVLGVAAALGSAIHQFLDGVSGKRK